MCVCVFVRVGRDLQRLTKIFHGMKSKTFIYQQYFSGSHTSSIGIKDFGFYWKKGDKHWIWRLQMTFLDLYGQNQFMRNPWFKNIKYVIFKIEKFSWIIIHIIFSRAFLEKYSINLNRLVYFVSCIFSDVRILNYQIIMFCVVSGISLFTAKL